MKYKRTFSKLTTRIADFTASPFGLLCAFVSIILGLATALFLKFSDSYMLIYNLFLSVVTYLMLFILQASQSRDTKILNTRIDCLIHASEASDQLIQLEKEEDEKIDSIREVLKEVKDQ